MTNERVVEIPWLLSRLGKPARILDIGSAFASYLTAMLEVCGEVVALDTHPFNTVDGVQVVLGDASDLPEDWSNHFDLVTCVSVLDHIGLEAYGNSANLQALQLSSCEMLRVLQPGGRLLVTVPFGQDRVTIHPDGGQRVFGIEALHSLFPLNTWNWLGVWFWNLSGDEYLPSNEESCKAVGYDSSYGRAESVVAIELEKAVEP